LSNVHQTPGRDEHLSAATLEMLHLAEFSTDHALGISGVWLFGSGAVPLVAAAPWSVCGDVDLTMLGKRIAAAGGTFRVKLVDSWRQYRGDPLDFLDLNRIVLDRLDAGLRWSSNNGNPHRGAGLDPRGRVRERECDRRSDRDRAGCQDRRLVHRTVPVDW
jgi:hypothetical protein